ncbi:hypothetical protein HMPREF1624_04971 [Sporothrix schenckii ATCC 58251]|uniref:non-specific serine/threonine protein kinase n=1 Tax=Sporothrix schenckii (strain ATCC 58251 / de Perez 2211183) TaxID=1391915 RepID=U7PUN5_SPOS1|nr:hypothetical protein HMPREF1624_04971 [Sporothrix schenckii ATCC 58251]
MPRRRRPRAKEPKKPKFKIPFLDRGRPASPFCTESRWTIQQHEPLPPFGTGYKTKHRRGEEILAQMREEQLPQSIYCLDNQPPGPEPAEDAPRLDIEVADALRPLLTCGAHVVACRILSGTIPSQSPSSSSSFSSSTATACPPPPSSSPATIVAKIFDPMYYYHNGDYDIVDLADMEYCRETAAYQHLVRQGVDGKLLPAYFGSYSLELPLTDEQKECLAEVKGEDHPLLQVPTPVRRVRLILMERVEGRPMTAQLVYGDVNGMTNEARLDVVASTLEAYARLYFHGITHGDLAPRNVFLKDESETVDDLTKCKSIAARRLRFHRFVDLGLAYVLGHPESSFPRQPTSEMRPRNPIRLFWHVFDSGAVNMYYWLPKEMRSTETFQLWMLRRWYGDTRFESVGAVPIPVKNDAAWERGEALTNETWPDTNGEDLQRCDGDGDGDGDGDEDENGHGNGNGNGNAKRGWQLPSALARAMATIPGLRAISIVIKQPTCAIPDDKTVAAVCDASHTTTSRARQLDEIETQTTTTPPTPPTSKATEKDQPKGFR